MRDIFGTSLLVITTLALGFWIGWSIPKEDCCKLALHQSKLLMDVEIKGLSLEKSIKEAVKNLGVGRKFDANTDSSLPPK
jgi:hypothetical protein